MSGRYEVQRVTTYVEYEALETFDTLEDAQTYADELYAEGGTFGASVSYEILEDHPSHNEVVYEVGA